MCSCGFPGESGLEANLKLPLVGLCMMLVIGWFVYDACFGLAHRGSTGSFFPLFVYELLASFYVFIFICVIISFFI